MKVLMQSRTTLFTVPGGDTVQIVKTKEYLERLGLSVAISTELEPDVSGYDIVHLFNLDRPHEVYLQAMNAKRQGKKLALSASYFSYAGYEKTLRGGLSGLLAKVLGPHQLEYLKIAARAALNREMNKGTCSLLRHGYRTLQKKILAVTDILLTNSRSERQRVIADFPEAGGKEYIIVPNAVDVKLFSAVSPQLPPEIEKYRDCVLCVARIEELKNQLNLVRAMKNLPWQLVLIGSTAPNHAAYFEKIRGEAGPDTHILGEIEHAQLAKYYRAARVHVLASWMETTGQSSLEAGATGCSLVITAKGDTREYVGKFAQYCEPDSVESVRAAILRAYEAPPAGLQNHIFNNFTWENTAKRTLAGYKNILC
jgi:glycosyltransferase involved in cell wall biosynthesis